MELNNLKNGFPSVIERAVKRDISDIICMLVIEYDITERRTKRAATKEELYQKIMEKFELEDAYCSAITKNGTKCTRRIQAGRSKFCGTHAILERVQAIKTFSEAKTHIVQSVKANISNDVLSKMRKEFIEDSFFLVDEEYIYDKDSYEKVGYIDNESGVKKFVLTDDPFILNS